MLTSKTDAQKMKVKFLVLLTSLNISQIGFISSKAQQPELNILPLLYVPQEWKASRTLHHCLPNTDGPGMLGHQLEGFRESMHWFHIGNMTTFIYKIILYLEINHILKIFPPLQFKVNLYIL